MSIVIAIIVVCAVTATWVAYPLFLPQSDKFLGDGLEKDDRVTLWRQEKDRLVEDMVALDLAFNEGRVNNADYDAQRSLVMLEAEKAAEKLGKLRAAESSAQVTSPRSYRRLAAGFAVGATICGAGLTFFLSGHDLETNINPHASGRIPLPVEVTASTGAGVAAPIEVQANGPAMPSQHSEGAPDVGAMVSRLEARVNGSDATVNDVLLLARSYKVLNKENESLELYRKAAAMEPEDKALKLVLASALIRSDRDTNRAQGEQIVDGVLLAEPQKPEALWLKSLGLISRHEIGQARKILTQLTSLVGDNADAKNAVHALLNSLSDAPSAVDTPPQGSTPKGTEPSASGAEK